MGTGWRRAFCTTIRRDQPSNGSPAPVAVAASSCSDADSDVDGSSTAPTVVPAAAAGVGAMASSSSPRSHSRLSFFSLGGGSGLSKCGGGSSSSSSASRVLPPATASEPVSPVLRCRTGKTKNTGDEAAPSAAQMNQTAVTATVSAPCSPRPPSPFAALRNTLRLSRRSCGVCLQSVKAVRGTAIFIAECSHAFHFPCISTHVRKQRQGGQLVCPVCSAAWCQAPLLSFHPRGGLDHEGTDTTIDPPMTGPPETSVPSAPAIAAAAEANDTGPWSQAIKQSSSALGSMKLLPPVPVEQDIVSKLTVKTSVAKKASTGKEGDGIPSNVSKSSGELQVLKPYNDDEPLLTPGGSRFNPIPETAEEYDGCDDPYGSSSSSSSKQQQRLQSDVVGSSSSSPGGVRLQVTLGTDVAFLSTNRGSSSHGTTTTLSYVASLKVKTHLLVPLDSPSRRAPVDLVVILDVGDGMVAPKFQTQKRAIRLLISSLGPNDRLSVIAYSATAKRLLPLRRMNTHGHRSARHVLERLVLGQGAGAASDALRKAAKVLADRRERNPVGSVLLLSDGQRPQQLLQQKGAPHAASRHSSSLACMFSSNTAASGTRFAHLEIPVYGGSGDQHQRTGQLSPPPPHDSSEAAFARCVSGLFSVVAQDAKMELEFAAGFVAGVYSSRGQPSTTSVMSTTTGGESGGVAFVLGDLYSEEERELFVELRVPSVARGESPHTNIESPWGLTARCSYVVPATRELVLSGGDQSFPFPQLQAAVISEQPQQQQHQHHHHRWLHHSLLPRSPRSSSPRPPLCPASELLKHQFLTARAITESRRLSESGEYSAAAQVLTTTRSALLQRHTGSGSGSAEEGARALEGELAELQRRRQQQRAMTRRRRRGGSSGGGADRNPADVEAAQDGGGGNTGGGEALTPTSAWRAAERLAKVAMMRKSLNRRVSDLHGFEDARF